MQAPKIVAEIGCNHKGDLNIAKEMIQVAASFAGADVAKFQKRSPKELLTQEQYDAPHPVPANAYGTTYGQHREHLEFTLEQHRQLKEWCEKAGIEYSSSVWDLTSAKEITSLQPEFVKVGSASNTHFEMIGYLCDHFGGGIHISLGMTTHDEEQRIVEVCEAHGRAMDVVLYACTSGYPVPFEDLCLLEIQRLRERFGERVGAIGFSGHHLGIAADIAAMTLGAEWIERHFTLDRTWKGTDHAASLEPDGLRRLVRDTRAVSKALRSKGEPILPLEKPQREKLKWLTP